MNIDKIFSSNKYRNILYKHGSDNDTQLNMDCFLDENKTFPSELIGIYISDLNDELYIVLDSADISDIDEFCLKWDKKISFFISFGSENREALHKLKYNIVQLVLVYQDSDYEPIESSLTTSRKILIPCTKNDSSYEIKTDNLIEIPFYLNSDHSGDDNSPSFSIPEKYNPSKDIDVLLKKIDNKGKAESFNEKDYSDIMEWINNVQNS